MAVEVDGAAAPETTFRGRRWMVPGGTEDAHTITLYVFVSDEYGDNVARHEVRLTLTPENVNGLRVGIPYVDGEPAYVPPPSGEQAAEFDGLLGKR